MAYRKSAVGAGDVSIVDEVAVEPGAGTVVGLAWGTVVAGASDGGGVWGPQPAMAQASATASTCIKTRIHYPRYAQNVPTATPRIPPQETRPTAGLPASTGSANPAR